MTQIEPSVVFPDTDEEYLYMINDKLEEEPPMCALNEGEIWVLLDSGSGVTAAPEVLLRMSRRRKDNRCQRWRLLQAMQYSSTARRLCR